MKLKSINKRRDILIKGESFGGGVAQEFLKSETFLLMDLGSRNVFFKSLIESPN
jgi:hypothetical protein